ncbi:hypothetical protein DPEC_G00146470 [Dallia pectoralis]|uniref:Uncharacterized protein n=1 Tax=Dallia pectoralis TaxID=75939 RepID=A0ACC2GPT7_DALPE|nr:hypothetical protein DPEC_G00146470 [Dallia pectoralis]
MAHPLTNDELDEQFELFMKESVSDDSVDLGGSAKCSGVPDRAAHKIPAKKTSAASAVLWWQKDSDEDSEETPGRGMLRSARTFRKSLRESQPIQEEEDEEQKLQEDEKGSEAVIFSRDSLESEESVMASRQGQTMAIGLGMDTLEEELEKASFFGHLEGGASSTIDYSRLNRDLDSSTITLGKAEVAIGGIDQRKGEPMESKLSPASPYYSEDEDFQEESSGNEDIMEENPKRPAMLAKVCLHDSLDSASGLPPLGADSDLEEELGRNKRAMPVLSVQSYGHSGVSDMEALQDAYKQFSGSVDSDHHPVSPSRRERSPGSSLVHGSPRGTAHPPVSTIESELHTAAELMCLIQPPNTDPFRAVTLQTASGTKLSPEMTDQSCEPTHSKQPNTSAASTGPQQNSIREQNLIMQDPEISSSDLTCTQPSKAKRRQQVSGPTSITGPSTSSIRKPYVAPGRRVKSKSSAMASRTSGHRPVLTKPRFRSEAKLPSSPTHEKTTDQCPSPVFLKKAKGLDCGELVVEGQPPAACLQQQHQVDATCYQDTSQTVSQKSKWQQYISQTQGTPQPFEKKVVGTTENTIYTREEPLLQHNKELSSLRQENYLLQSKLRSAEEANSKCRWHIGLCNSLDPLTKSKLGEIEKEVMQQETLIQGYHQENEKLYLQMKALQAQSKLNEEAMFAENRRLLNELSFTKEQLSKRIMPRNVQNIGCVDHVQRITELQGQMEAAQRTEERLIQENQMLKQEKQALEVDLQMMRKERDLAKTHVVYTSADKSFELHVMEERHKEEVCALKKKLQWYAENQEMLDRDAARLRAATAETHKLTEQVEKLKMEVGMKANESKLKQRTREAKRIQDLERQVKEMEEILRRRNPNSLTALIYAAANTPAVEEEGGAKSIVPTQTTGLLERRIQKLEAELEGHNDVAKRSLRAMEQQYQRIRLKYEQQISDLEQRLAQKHHHQDLTQSAGVWEAQVHSLQDQLVQVKESSQSREDILQAKVHSLEVKLIQQKSKPKSENPPEHSPSRHQRQAETALGVRIERLNQELTAKTRTIQELSRTVERLQRDQRSRLSGPDPRLEAKQKVAVANGPVVVPPEKEATVGGDTVGGDTAAFPSTQDEKDYQPKTFSGSHISEVLQESEVLRLRLEQLEHQRNEERGALLAETAQAQDQLHRFQKLSAEQLTSLNADHQRELERLLTHISITNSSSKVAELTNQVKSQEMMVQHLRDQVKELHGTRDALAVSKLREDTLQNQLTKLLEELKQAKESQSPELRHFTSLERKIHNLELRHSQREKELQQVISQTRLVVEVEKQSELERWRSLAQEKNRELEVFRLELDSILDVLRELQRQGVVIPPSDRASSLPFIWKT